jgi:hypothetical protein
MWWRHMLAPISNIGKRRRGYEEDNVAQQQQHLRELCQPGTIVEVLWRSGKEREDERWLLAVVISPEVDHKGIVREARVTHKCLQKSVVVQPEDIRAAPAFEDLFTTPAGVIRRNQLLTQGDTRDGEWLRRVLGRQALGVTDLKPEEEEMIPPSWQCPAALWETGTEFGIFPGHRNAALIGRPSQRNPFYAKDVLIVQPSK